MMNGSNAIRDSSTRYSRLQTTSVWKRLLDILDNACVNSIRVRFKGAFNIWPGTYGYMKRSVNFSVTMHGYSLSLLDQSAQYVHTSWWEFVDALCGIKLIICNSIRTRGSREAKFHTYVCNAHPYATLVRYFNRTRTHYTQPV